MLRMGDAPAMYYRKIVDITKAHITVYINRRRMQTSRKHEADCLVLAAGLKLGLLLGEPGGV